MTNPTKAAEAMRPSEFVEGLRNALYRRFPRCRDCADDGPICPNSNLPCNLAIHFDRLDAIVSRAMPLPEPAHDPRDAAIARAIEFIEEACGYEGEAADVSDRLARAIGREPARSDPRDAVSLHEETCSDAKKLAREIQNDVMAGEDEIANAIEAGFRFRENQIRATIARLSAELETMRELMFDLYACNSVLGEGVGKLCPPDGFYELWNHASFKAKGLGAQSWKDRAVIAKLAKGE